MWPLQLEQQRNIYLDFVRDIIGGRGEIEHRAEDDFVLEQIRRDARRTLPSIGMFQSQVRASPYSLLTSKSGYHSRKSSASTIRSLWEGERSERWSILSNSTIAVPTTPPSRSKDVKKGDIAVFSPITPLTPPPKKTVRRELYEKVRHLVELSGSPSVMMHWEVIERILFIYARLNPVVGYVQGMNCLLAPIYWVFANDPDPVNQAHAEADAFFCFSALMSDARDHFLGSMDADATSGIHASLARLQLQLERLDPELSYWLRECQLEIHYFAFRWYTCLFVQDWLLPEVLRIWDSLLAAKERGTFMGDFGCAMLMSIRQELLEGTFESNVKLLQAYPEGDVNKVLRIAYLNRERIRERSSTTGKWKRALWRVSALIARPVTR